jgi:hypothetical protein
MEDTLKTIRSIVTISLFAVAVLSCNLFQRPFVADGPGFEVWTPTSQQPVEATISVVEPTLDQTVYARAQIGTYQSVWVTFDPAVWNAVQWIDGVNQSNEHVEQLVHKTLTECSLHDNLGHGAPETWSFGKYTREIGQVIFQIEQWTDTTTNNPVLVIYQYPADEYTSTTKRIELETGSGPYDCINAADEVIGLSLTDITQ